MGIPAAGLFGLESSELSFGTGTFGGGTEFFRAWGHNRRQRSQAPHRYCMEAGINLFDTADVYSRGLSEEILGKAIGGKRQNLLISTKTTFRFGDGPNDAGSSRYHIVRAVEASLRRLNTDYIDIYHMHGFDQLTPIEENPRSARHTRPHRQGPLHRLLQFFRLALDEIPFHLRALRLGPVRRPSGLLLPYRPRLRTRTHASRHRSKSRRSRLESPSAGAA